MTTLQFETQVSGSRDTVWVNASDGSCVARFSKKFGIDVHNSATAQMQGAKECLMCTHAPAGEDEWERFRAAVLEHYGVKVRKNLLRF
ncbi:MULTISPECIES: hypothetical protein [unclassified Variovorax]|uniref:hypothetical protein n=1 Tax=unclassified Variovorax TaxID=663243 RepID=UPI00076BC259|nr:MULTISPECIES: hypothetical protein [unclassified Variovorax]KWT98284.1 hypothetical protein APY03_0419 [Variovorax sp. WDL1]PNG50061.1 hypothetical protein CHC06_05643 [Variovorax sp. B2]PNG50933.1 hypothetical protein CHC07_05548 [Variovorax sp. B4]VTU41638.1 hypothetical protein SRS16P1_00056 [Variovorax sp. SRS16]VTU41671.1 hypothetical protein E5P1_00056 [Variovorax sp. PBL-E5]